MVGPFNTEIYQYFLDYGYTPGRARDLASRNISPEGLAKFRKERESARQFVDGYSDEDRLWIGAYAQLLKGKHAGTNYFGHRLNPEEKRIIVKTFDAYSKRLAAKYHPELPDSRIFEYNFGLDSREVRVELLRRSRHES